MEKYSRGVTGIFEFLSRVAATKPKKNSAATSTKNSNLEGSGSKNLAAEEIHSRISRSGMKLTIFRKKRTISPNVGDTEVQPAKKSRRNLIL